MPRRTLIIGKADAGRSVAQVLREHWGLEGKEAAALLKRGDVRLDSQPCQPHYRVRRGQRLILHEPKHAETPDHGIRVVHVDAEVVVVDKPAGLTTVRHASEAAQFGQRARKFLPSTLIDWLPKLVPQHQGRLRAVHRLDKETSGLLVVARTPQAESHLGKQFRSHAVERTYLALVRGAATDADIATHLVADRGDGRRGSGAPDEGQRAVTHVRVVEALDDFTLVECRLETGRTHQVRIHLGEQETPLCGEAVYDRPLHGTPLPDASAAARPMLHAATLAFDHPKSGERLRFETPLPDDMRRLLDRLRRRL